MGSSQVAGTALRGPLAIIKDQARHSHHTEPGDSREQCLGSGVSLLSLRAPLQEPGSGVPVVVSLCPGFPSSPVPCSKDIAASGLL